MNWQGELVLSFFLFNQVSNADSTIICGNRKKSIVLQQRGRQH